MPHEDRDDGRDLHDGFVFAETFAASTTFLDGPAGADRSASSRATTTTAIHAGSQPRPTSAMNAEQTMILSASGSIRMPKFVIRFRRRAMSPSRKSLMAAATNNASANVSK
jgi:hypothetical protein